MKTTVDINDELLKKAAEATGIKTKRGIIELGLREVIRKKNLEALRKELGTYDLALTLEELEKLRNGR